MRLVDVEPFDFISFNTTDNIAYDQGFEDGVQFVAEKLDAAPTIDAIPVEWLWVVRDKMLKNPWYNFEQCAVVGQIIRAWQKEQEART